MHIVRSIITTAAVCAVVTLPAASWAKKCPGDSVQVGDVCVDKYEASVWSTTDTAIVNRIKKGKILSAGDLATATQHGAVPFVDDYGAGCPDTGNGCVDYYAVSIAGVVPSAYMTWFQAAAACRNAGKHLITNQEWQAAAFGTPDTAGADNGTTDCNTDSTFIVELTGSRASCTSDTGAFDMVGSLMEWTADWAPVSTTCTNWGGLSNDRMCLSGASTTDTASAAFLRGGTFEQGTSAGIFSIEARVPVSYPNYDQGFRCARRL